MGEKEKTDIHQLIDTGIKESMKEVKSDMRWIFGIANGIVLLIISVLVLPMYQDVSNKIDSDEAYKNFLTKGNYHFLQKEQNKAIEQAIKLPSECHSILRENVNTEAEQLEIRTRSAIQLN